MEFVNQFISLYSNEIILATFLLAIICIIMVSINSFRMRKINKRYYRMMYGMENKNLEAMLISHLDALNEGKAILKKQGQDLEAFSKQLETTIQGVAMLRYNPFDQMGGDQSFSIALLDGRGDGIVLTSLYSREGSAVFAKPIVDKQSKYPLSNEEQEAIKIAFGKLNV
jgi:hypothetical protein